MKIWIKYILGCIFGFIVFVSLPLENGSISQALQFISDLAIRSGRYILLPLLFFTMTVVVCELRQTRMLFSIAIRTVFITIFSSALLTIIGMASVLVVDTPLIPISIEESNAVFSLNIIDNLLKLFPYSGFEGFIDGAYLLPLYVLAGFAGAGCASETPANIKPTITLFDSLSRVSYAIVSFFIDVISVGVITITALWYFKFASIWELQKFNKLIVILLVDLLLIAVVIYPLLTRILFKERHPYKILYASLASLIMAFFTGDANLTLAINLRHAKESLGIRRRIGSVCLPVFSTFARGGSALVVSACFVVIMKCYSNNTIHLQDLIWIFSMSFATSFFLGAMPTGCTFVVLTVLCAMFGKIYEPSYLILQPISFILCSVATAIDSLTSMFGTYVIAAKKKMIISKEIGLYI